MKLKQLNPGDKFEKLTVIKLDKIKVYINPKNIKNN